MRTFMYQQVLTEAPWIDAIVRGEGEEILINLVRLIDQGRWPADRHEVKGWRLRNRWLTGRRSSPQRRRPPSRTWT